MRALLLPPSVIGRNQQKDDGARAMRRWLEGIPWPCVRERRDSAADTRRRQRILFRRRRASARSSCSSGHAGIADRISSKYPSELQRLVPVGRIDREQLVDLLPCADLRAVEVERVGRRHPADRRLDGFAPPPQRSSTHFSTRRLSPKPGQMNFCRRRRCGTSSRGRCRAPCRASPTSSQCAK